MRPGERNGNCLLNMFPEENQEKSMVKLITSSKHELKSK